MAQTVFINARFLTQQITGVQQFAFEICRYLNNQEVEFVLLAPANTVCPKALSHLSFQCIGKSKGYVWEQIELPAYLKKRGSPLLINFCNMAPLFYRNQWVTIHDLAYMHHPEWFSTSFAKVYRYIIPRIALRSKKILTVSETIKNQLIEQFELVTEKVAVIYNGVPFELVSRPLEKKPIRQKMVLTVSSINPRKNLRYLIAAFSEANLNDYNLVIVGAANSVFGKDPLIVPSNVQFVGYVSNEQLQLLYQQAALFISLSLDEGFGIPVLEAIVHDCPVLLSDIDVYKECFSGVAEFAPINDIAATASVIKNQLALMDNNLNRRIPGEIKLALLKKYNYEASANKLLELIRETLKIM